MSQILVPRKSADVLRDLRFFANGLAVRYGVPVYLVGSALTSEDPRDYDIRVVLGDDDFQIFFGCLNDKYERREDGTLVWGRTYWRLGYAELKHSRAISRSIGANVDVKFIHEDDRGRYLVEGKFRRIDEAPDWLFSAGSRP